MPAGNQQASLRPIAMSSMGLFRGERAQTFSHGATNLIDEYLEQVRRERADMSALFCAVATVISAGIFVTNKNTLGVAFGTLFAVAAVLFLFMAIYLRNTKPTNSKTNEELLSEMERRTSDYPPAERRLRETQAEERRASGAVTTRRTVVQQFKADIAAERRRTTVAQNNTDDAHAAGIGLSIMRSPE